MDNGKNKSFKKNVSKEKKIDIDKIKKERDEYLDGWKRAMADLANYKKDEAKRMEKVVSLANEKLIYDLLVVLDSFNLAINSMEKSESVNKGIYLIKAQLEDILKKYGLEIIETNPGDKFDPEIHDAISVVDNGGDDVKSETVVDEVEVGYKLNGKVLRPSRVRVYK